MTLKADILTDLDDVFYDTDEFAESVSYTASGEEAATVTIVREEQDPSIMSDPPPDDEMIILVKSADVADPQRGDTFIIDDETWYLKANLGISGGEARLSLTRSGWRQA